MKIESCGPFTLLKILVIVTLDVLTGSSQFLDPPLVELIPYPSPCGI
jgi:hypothetical protein